MSEAEASTKIKITDTDRSTYALVKKVHLFAAVLVFVVINLAIIIYREINYERTQQRHEERITEVERRQDKMEQKMDDKIDKLADQLKTITFNLKNFFKTNKLEFIEDEQ
jgi:hypothetical protein